MNAEIFPLQFYHMRLDICIVSGKTIDTIGIHRLFTNPLEGFLLSAFANMLNITPRFFSQPMQSLM